MNAEVETKGHIQYIYIYILSESVLNKKKYISSS